MRRARVRAALALAFTAIACGGAVDHHGDEALDARLRLSPTPPMVGSAGVAVRATDGGVPMALPGRVAVSVRGEGDGPTALGFEDGLWIGTLEFEAPGERHVEVTITTADGRTATLGIPVRVVGRP